MTSGPWTSVAIPPVATWKRPWWFDDIGSVAARPSPTSENSIFAVPGVKRLPPAPPTHPPPAAAPAAPGRALVAAAGAAMRAALPALHDGRVRFPADLEDALHGADRGGRPGLAEHLAPVALE